MVNMPDEFQSNTTSHTDNKESQHLASLWFGISRFIMFPLFFFLGDSLRQFMPRPGQAFGFLAAFGKRIKSI